MTAAHERAKAKRRGPPAKKAGDAVGPRRINGQLFLDVAAASALTGYSEKSIRARVERRVLPFRRDGSRLIFLRAELLAYVAGLPGCDLKEATANLASRREAAP